LRTGAHPRRRRRSESREGDRRRPARRRCGSPGSANAAMSDLRRAVAVHQESRGRRREIPSRTVGLLRMRRGVRRLPVPTTDEKAAKSLTGAPALSGGGRARPDDRDERVHKTAVAPALSCFVRQHLKGLVGETRGAVRPYGRQRVEDIDNADDLREERHFTVPQTVWITGAVEPLVMMADDWPHLVQRSQPG